MISLSQACKAQNAICGAAKKIVTTESKHILKTTSEAGQQIIAIDKATGEVAKTIVKEAPIDGILRLGNNIFHGKQKVTKVYNAKGELIQINRLTKLDDTGRAVMESVTNPNSENRVIKVVSTCGKNGGMAHVSETHPNNFNYDKSYWITQGQKPSLFYDGTSSQNLNFAYHMGF